MEHIGDHLGKFNLDSPVVKNGRVPRERDELLDFFHSKMEKAYKRHSGRKLTKKYIAIKISHLKEKDLYFLKSVCLDAERRGKSFSMVFWSELKVR
jgi:hypothetical protein